MDTTLIVVIVAIVAALVIIRLWLNGLESKSKPSDELVEWLKQLGQRVETSTQSVDQKLSKNMEMFNNRLDNASILMNQVQKSIGEFSEIGRSMQELQEILQSPKLRGNMGEHILKELLIQYFPESSYAFQHTFKNGEKVDAIIKTTQGMIPIDAKFPFENFRKMMECESKDERVKVQKEFEKDVKKHILDISQKYILVSEGTVDYALMYIPSEAIYYEIINTGSLCDYAADKRILAVSPMSFYAYMKSILMSFEGQKIQSQAKEILLTLKSIKKDYEKTDEAISVLQKHIGNSYNQLSNVTKLFSGLGQKLDSTHLLSGTEKKLLEEDALDPIQSIQSKLLD
ncbi:MAG: DNA recombination protein RmuC [Patescibacteria group bacterium]